MNTVSMEATRDTSPTSEIFTIRIWVREKPSFIPQTLPPISFCLPPKLKVFDSIPKFYHKQKNIS